MVNNLQYLHGYSIQSLEKDDKYYYYIMRGEIIMKKIITKLITTITIMAVAFTMVMPATTQAATKVKLNRTNVTINVNQSYQLKVKGTARKVTWKSSNRKVAVVSRSGKVTGKKSGKAVITAKVNKKSYKCRVTVKPNRKPTVSSTRTSVKVKRVKEGIYNVTLNENVKNVALTARSGKTNVTKKSTWKSLNKNIVTITRSGKITARKAGKAKATVSYKGKKTTLNVTVNHNWKKHYTVNNTAYTTYLFFCSCGWVFLSEEYYIYHVDEMSSVYNDGGHSFSGDILGNYERYFHDYSYCTVCKKRRINPEKHLQKKRHENYIYYCTCGAEFVTAEALKKHLAKPVYNAPPDSHKAGKRLDVSYTYYDF